MESRPLTVKGLSLQLGISFTDLLIPCCFCQRFLTNVEKSLCDSAPFNLRWKDECVFGCCQSCIRHCGRLEQACYFERQLSETEVKNLDLNLFWIRCQWCMRTLTLQEKQICGAEQSLSLVRGRVRGRCGLCRLSAV